MTASPVVHVVDDDADLRDSLQAMLGAAGYACATYGSAAEFLRSAPKSGCALVDVRMPETDGLALLEQMAAGGIDLPVIMMTGFADVPLAVKAMKAGALDFIEKPCPPELLLDAVRRALASPKAAPVDPSEKTEARERLGRLTDRERDVMELLVAGDPNKIIAHKLGISPRTVEIHRSRLMEKAQVRSLPDLVRLAIAAEMGGKSPSG